MNPYDHMFAVAGYYPCRCPEHPDHAVNRDDTSGDMRCTSGHLVLPIDLGERRITEALKGAAT